MRNFSLLAVVLVVCLAACGGEKDKPTTVQTVNTHCPLMQEHEVDPEITVDYQGKKVGFCCPKCIPKWEALSDEEKAKAL
ncbi:MAG: hypothetical protein KDB18_13680, partial [Salinibacterium sp.]|nr:hypothetical protein [Salinibacterium sp.]